MTTTIPSAETRDRNADMKALARKAITDRLSFRTDGLTAHVAESPDLLTSYVTTAIGATLRIDWMEATEMECIQERNWAAYCTDLFDGVQGYVMNLLA